jgi:hypothetical protein
MIENLNLGQPRQIDFLQEFTDLFITCLEKNLFDDFCFDPVDGFFYAGQPHYIKDRLSPIGEILDTENWKKDIVRIKQNILGYKAEINLEKGKVILEDEYYQLHEAVRNYLLTHVKEKWIYLFS